MSRVHFAILFCAALAAGCSGGGFADDGVKPNDKLPAANFPDLAKKVDGNYDKLDDSEKKEFLDMDNGNEQQARSMVSLMAHPVNDTNSRTRPSVH